MLQRGCAHQWDLTAIKNVFSLCRFHPSAHEEMPSRCQQKRQNGVTENGGGWHTCR